MTNKFDGFTIYAIHKDGAAPLINCNPKTLNKESWLTKMGDKNIKKETKKPKKTDKATSPSLISPSQRPIAVQPELIKKEKKNK